MRLLHSSDWHLGHLLHNVSRVEEHDCFLSWLTEVLIVEEVDVLLVTGDIFDSSNPPAEVWRRWYRFLVDVTKRAPHLQIVAIGGNHDSAARLEAPNPLLESMNVHVIGGIPRKDRAPNLDRMTIPLKNRAGEIEAWCAAMPFVRVADLPPVEVKDGGDRFIEGVRALYDQLLTAVAEKAEPNQAVIATGHCYMANAQLSEWSERKILGGNLHALPNNLFPDSLTYVALGHMHKHQIVNGKDWIRYSGSPIPLSLKEIDYGHQVYLIETEGAALREVKSLTIPRFVDILQIAPGPLEAVLEALSGLPLLSEGTEDWKRPYLEVTVQLPKPSPNLRRRIEEAMTGKAPRLLKISTEYTGDGMKLGEQAPALLLKELKAEEVFVNCYKQTYPGEPSSVLLSFFHELLEQASQEGS